ncbi:MAG: hypothetical protein WC480_03395 [Patescibacteria group bacterium]
MYLLINTIVNDQIRLGLANRREVIDQQITVVGYRQAERLLSLLNKFLGGNNIEPSRLTGIIVLVGPGSFSSVRLGIVTANTLGYTLGIPVAGLKFKDENVSLESLFEDGLSKLINKRGFNLVQPFYGREPNITKPKQKHYGK